jgi:F0F1-type ATP synthase assembly protein I
MSVAALRPARAAGAALARLLLGQFVKVLLTIAMFIVVAQREDVVWPALMFGYIATMVVFWVVPVVDGPRQPPRSLGKDV